MYPLILSMGEATASDGLGTPGPGAREFELINPVGFEMGEPVFIESDAYGGTRAMGRLDYIDTPVLRTEWAFTKSPGAEWRAIIPENYVIISPHTFPLIHRELMLGVEDQEGDGGNFRETSLREPSHIIRVRIQRPDSELLEKLRLFGEALAAAPTLRFQFTDIDRSVRHIALAGQKLVVESIAWEAGEPFDLMMREV